MYHYEYLNDADFLKEFTNEKIIEQYVKIIVLDWSQQHKIKEISGKTLGGSINVDATSAMRRTATVQILVDEESNKLTDINNLISINKKIDLQVGFKNFTNKYLQYPILWFPQGRFLIINANISYEKDNYVINLTLHDKMALLNGECGGVLPAPITFNEMEDEDPYGNIETTNPKISSIIKELIIHWGNQSERNILINDIDPYIRQVLRWAPEDKNKQLFYFDLSPSDPICKEIPQLIQVENNISNNKSQFYEKLLTNLIAIGMKKNKDLKINSYTFPNSSLIVKYLLEEVSSKDIKDLKNIIQNLEQISTNFETLLENYKQETSSLIELKQKIENQITTSPEEIIDTLKNLCDDTNKYYKDWKTECEKYKGKEREEDLIIFNKIKEKITQSYDIKWNNYINILLKLVDKLPRYPLDSKGFHLPNPFSEEITSKYTITNLRDAGKYIINNSGIFSELSEKDKKEIEKDNQEYITFLYERINLIPFEKNFSRTLDSIERTHKNHEIKFIKHYILFFEKNYKEKEPQSLKKIRTTLSQELQIVNNRLKKIQQEQLKILQKCNQVYKKWFKKDLSSYIKLLQTPSFVEDKAREQLNIYKKNKRDIETNINQNMNISKKWSNRKIDTLKNIQLVNNEFNSPYFVSTMNHLSTNIKKQSEIKENFSTVSNLNFQEEQIRLLEQDIDQQTIETKQDVTVTVLEAIDEIKQSIAKKRDLLIKLIEDWENKKFKFIKNFLQNTQAKSQQQFYIAFAKAALYEDQQGRHYWKNTINKNVEDMLMQDRKLIYTNFFGGSIPTQSKEDDIPTQNKEDSTPTQSKEETKLINSNFEQFWENIYYKLIIPAFKNSTNGIKTFNYGDDIGYTLTEFIFPGELICQPGDTITSVLDKIKNTLGNYEYFYNIDGQFVFQEIKNYLNTSYSTFLSKSVKIDKLSKNYYNSLQFAKYDFSDENIIQSYQNTPQYELIKNDFLIWGERKSVEGQKIPIRYHLAIDAQPASSLYYFFDVPLSNIENYHYKKNLPLQPNNANKYKIFYVQQENCFYRWINQENGYYGYKQFNILTDDSKCLQFISKNNFPKQGKENYYYYDKTTKLLYLYNIKTNKYERTHSYSIKTCIGEYNKNSIGIIGQYYYSGNHIYLCTGESSYEDVTKTVGKLLTVNCIGTALYLQGVEAEKSGTKYNDYYTELKNEWPKLWDLWNNKMYIEVESNLSGIDYFLNILSSSSLVNQFGISKIGKRTKVISNNAINCIFEPICPDIMFFDENPPIEKNQMTKDIKSKQKDYLDLLKYKEKYLKEYNYNHLSNYKMVKVKHSIYEDIKVGGILRSAYEEIRSELYQYINYNEQISLTLLPIYYLEANDIIKLLNSETNINGNYIINNFSLPLNIDNSMNITCSKIISRI